jgi:hypothetical protein
MSTVAITAESVGRQRSYFFVAAAVLLLVTIFLGFSKTFYLRALLPEGKRLPVQAYLYVHGAVMTAWYALFAAQALLVSSNRVALHRRLGTVGAVLSIAVVITGAYVAVRVPGHLAAVGAPRELVLGLGGGLAIGSLLRLVVFTGLFSSAITLRRRPEWHRRLMFWSFLVLLDPALSDAGPRPLGPILESFLSPAVLHYLVPIVGFIALAAHDWLSAKRIHPATVLGGLVYMIYGGPLAFLIANTQTAHAFVERLI